MANHQGMDLISQAWANLDALSTIGVYDAGWEPFSCDMSPIRESSSDATADIRGVAALNSSSPATPRKFGGETWRRGVDRVCVSPPSEPAPLHSPCKRRRSNGSAGRRCRKTSHTSGTFASGRRPQLNFVCSALSSTLRLFGCASGSGDAPTALSQGPRRPGSSPVLSR